MVLGHVHAHVHAQNTIDFSLATPMKFGNFGPYFMLFYAHNHSNFMHSSCPVHAFSWHELGMNKGFNPIFHVHESYSHAHEVMPFTSCT